MKRLAALAIISVGILFWVQSLRQIERLDVATGIPQVTYLGEGGNHEIAPGLNFIVKRKSPFRFEMESGPRYNARDNERVWSTNGDAPQAFVQEWIDFGQVESGCVVKFLAIDDDPDDRINTFYLNGDDFYDMPQGLVTGGNFRVPRGGDLRLWAEDSIGVWVEPCDRRITNTPTATAEPTQTATVAPPTPVMETPTATPTETSTEGPSPTPSPSPSGTVSTPTTTSTPEDTSTPAPPTPTSEPTDTATPPSTATPDHTPTATKKPRLLSCFRINFELGGGSARKGIYEVREVGGRLLYQWYAEDGWMDSGWIRDIDITFEDMFVQVFYLPPDGSPPVAMAIVNPAPNTEYGWVTRGSCHSLEVDWPAGPPPDSTPGPTPTTVDGDNDPRNDPVEYWPGQEPSATPTETGSLRG